MKRVFLSFIVEDEDHVRGVRLLASSPKYSNLEFYDESVTVAYDSSDAEYIRSKIRGKLDRASVTVCLISETTHNSDWVAWELRESIDRRMTVIAMAVKGVNRAVLPKPIKDAGLTFHPWDSDRLGKLIADA